MNEKPIIMSSESVRAILAGRKTQTRRVCKPQPKYGKPERSKSFIYPNCYFDVRPDGITDCAFQFPHIVGDHIWVKEKYMTVRGVTEETRSIKYFCDTDENAIKVAERYKWWKNPMFMPRMYSRITLEVIDVRLDRLQEMSQGDVYAEGFPPIFSEFKKAWDKLNAKRGFSWDSNPYVWVINFKRIEN